MCEKEEKYEITLSSEGVVKMILLYTLFLYPQGYIIK